MRDSVLNEQDGASPLWGTMGHHSYPAASLLPSGVVRVGSDLSHSSPHPELHQGVRRAAAIIWTDARPEGWRVLPSVELELVQLPRLGEAQSFPRK